MPQISPMSWIFIMLIWTVTILSIISLMKIKTEHSSNRIKKIVFTTMMWNW